MEGGVGFINSTHGLVSLYVLAILGLISDLQDETCRDKKQGYKVSDHSTPFGLKKLHS